MVALDDMMALTGYALTRDDRRYGLTDCTVHWTYADVVVSSTYFPPDIKRPPYRCPGSRQRNNVAMLVHWSDSKQRCVFRDNRRFIRITPPRRLQRGRGR